MPASPQSLPDGAAIVNVEAAVYRDGDVLLATRAEEEDHAAGERSLVGGKLERDVDPERPLEATVEREVREEVGVDVTDATYVCSSAFELDDGTPVVKRRLPRTPRARRRPHPGAREVSDLAWVHPDHVLEDGGLPPWTADYLDRAETHRQRHGW